MLYVDTSVLIALCTNEIKTADVVKWYANCTEELASATWCVTEFASAVKLKQHTGQITEAQAQTAWLQFERICANDLELLPMNTITFRKAALLTMIASPSLRADDALHLACAMQAKAQGVVTLDEMLAKNAKRLKVKPVAV